jgi:hypothetical protein
MQFCKKEKLNKKTVNIAKRKYGPSKINIKPTLTESLNFVFRLNKIIFFIE